MISFAAGAAREFYESSPCGDRTTWRSGKNVLSVGSMDMARLEACRTLTPDPSSRAAAKIAPISAVLVPYPRPDGKGLWSESESFSLVSRPRALRAFHLKGGKLIWPLLTYAVLHISIGQETRQGSPSNEPGIIPRMCRG